MLQIRHSSLIAIHLTAVAMLYSNIILHTVDDILRQLEIKRENFSSFLTDAARYMSSAGKTLKELYPSLMHVTCVAHLLRNCAMRVHFKNIDEVIATIKAATIKNKDRKKDFHDAGLQSPPDPVITRWATWLRAALYYSENLPAVRTIKQLKSDVLPGLPDGEVMTTSSCWVRGYNSTPSPTVQSTLVNRTAERDSAVSRY